MNTKQNTASSTGDSPAIVLSDADFQRLHTLVRAAHQRMPVLAEELANEIERARVLDKRERPHAHVSMNSEVVFQDDMNGRVQTVTLVYPDQADTSAGRISVLTPIGTALIGLPVGGTIAWRSPYGASRKLTVLSVRQSDGD